MQRSLTILEVVSKARNRILREWHGGLNPPNPSRNIHRPGEFLDALLERVGIAEGIDEQRLKDAWRGVAGEFIAQNSMPESLKKGVLVLRVLQPVVRNQLEQTKGMLIEKLHRELGDGVVKDVIFKIG